MSENIAYSSDNIVGYFSQNRISWPQFYESERVIIARLGMGPEHTVLDIGCGCGGLGLALRDQFGVDKYTGVEINRQAAEAAGKMNSGARFICGDILGLRYKELLSQRFHVVFSLSCVDWNVRFEDMLNAAWDLVRPGGHLVATFRLTNGAGCNDRQQSYQYINFAGLREGEVASYVVLNAKELMLILRRFRPAAINAFGYWGTPSASAVTPYERLCFCAVSITKRDGKDGMLRLSVDLPGEIQDSIQSSQR